MTCESWSVELEKERRGALSAAQSSALDQHVAGCDRCRAEREEIAALDTDLSLSDGPASGWDDLRARLERARRRQRRELAVGVAVAVAAGAALILARGWVLGVFFDSFGSGLAAGIAAGICVAAVKLWLISRRDVAAPGTDLFAAFRRQVQWRIRSIRAAAVFLPLFILWTMLASGSRLWGGSATFKIAVVVAVVALALNGWFRVSRRLERELRELEGR